MLQAEVFCAQVEAVSKKDLSLSDMHALNLKINQCRGELVHLQELYETDNLTINDPAVCADFRRLVMSLLWVNFLGRSSIDFKLFRKLVQIESGLPTSS